MRGRPTKRTPQQRERFLDALAATQNVRLAAAVAGISPRLVYDWRRDDPTFKADCEAAREAGIDVLEGAAVRRALEALGRRTLLRGIELAQGADPKNISTRRDALTGFTRNHGDPRTDDEIETRIAQLLRKAGIEDPAESEGDPAAGAEG